MHVFDVYHHPEYGDEAVRRGFSWLAFLVPSVWAVRRGLGWTTLFLVAASTLMFDVAELASLLADWPMLQVPVLLLMVVVVGILPGFAGYRWHAAHLREEHFQHKCTIVADGRRQAIKAANDDSYVMQIRIASS
ncbi:MAG TPA: hypothetical protein VKN35_07635 [Xanthomonadales bacterium]|nr:hypothetical protein [Xanthomonadales bacterium]